MPLVRFHASSVALLIALSAAAFAADDDYKLGAESQVTEGVPTGTFTEHVWSDSKIFPGTTRKYGIYVPKQYDPKVPACLMVFQDGLGYANPKGGVHATTVIDNLIHKKEIPVMIGLFIQPGEFPAKDSKAKPRSNRSFEYDSLGDAYAKFLLEEMIPEVAKKYNLINDASSRAICGASSGGICAFTVAWEKPDAFSKVLSHIGSFTNIRGGHVYPSIIRKTEPKPIRVYLQDGSTDLDNMHGNWPLANQEMAAALKFAKYDYKFDYGTGGHNYKQAGAIFPDAMRWLWRDYKAPAAATK